MHIGSKDKFCSFQRLGKTLSKRLVFYAWRKIMEQNPTTTLTAMLEKQSGSVAFVSPIFMQALISCSFEVRRMSRCWMRGTLTARNGSGYSANRKATIVSNSFGLDVGTTVLHLIFVITLWYN